MNRTEAEKKVLSLREEIERHNHAYYEKAEPLISDQQYDALLRELLSLELEFDLQTTDSPTVRIGGKPNKSFPTVSHNPPLLSLSNSYSEGDLWDFDRRIKNLLEHEDFTYHVELKYDGMALRIQYEQGHLVLGATRGNGREGDDISANTRTIKDIPLSISLEGELKDKVLDIRGEAFMEREAFAQLNALREEEGETVFANPRNATAGTLKMQDPNIVAQRPIRFFAYDVLIEGVSLLQEQKIALLRSWGFPTSEYHRTCTTMEEVIDLINQWDNLRHALPFETDGAVIKINEDRFRDQLGATAKAPRWAMAYKYQAEQAPTIIQSITLQVGRLGTITPVAELTPVQLAGTTVKRASLHNEDEINRKDIRVGDTVLVEKAGEIIPQVISVINPDREQRSEPFKMPKRCPACSSELVKYEDEVAWRCINPECPPQIKHRIEHFASKAALDIDGLGAAIVEQLVNAHLISTYADLYELTLEDLFPLERMAQKSAQNLLESIEKSKNQPFSRVLYALGIRFVGTTVARDLAQAFSSIDALMEADETTIISVESIGPKIAHSLQNFFNNDFNQTLIQRLKSHGLQLESSEPTTAKGNQLEGVTFVITGTLPTLKRNEAKDLIEQHGGKVTGSVSKKTGYLLAGEEAGSKLDKATKLGIPILSEQDLFKLLND